MSYPLYVGVSLKNSSQEVGILRLALWDVANEDYGSLELIDGEVTFKDVFGSTIVFGAGDMVLASTQTVTGAKTFNNGTLLLRNVANTLSSQFTNTNTAARTYTLPNSTGTVALTSDITGTNSGTNTGDQTITLTGAVTGSGTGSFVASLGTFTKSQLDTAVSDGNVLYEGDAPTAHNQAWSTITSTPTTLTGYGITDAASVTHVHSGTDITSGTVDPARLGSGSGISTKFLRGDSTWQTISGGGGGGGGSTPTDITVANEATDTTCFLAFFTAATGDLGPKTNGALTYNSATSVLACTTFVGALTGNASTVTTNANLTGHVTSVGNAAVLGSFTKSQLDTAVGGNVLYLGDVTSNATHTGDVTGSTALTIAENVVTPAMQTAAGRTFTICGFGLDGGGTAIAVQTLAATFRVPVAMTLTGYSAECDTGTFMVKFWKVATGTSIPTDFNSINNSGVGISTGTAIRSTTLTDFTTTAFAAGDIVRCQLIAVSGATWIKVALEGTKN